MTEQTAKATDEGVAETVARAICRASGKDPDGCAIGSGSVGSNGYSESQCYLRHWQSYVAFAHAAIAAMPATQPVQVGEDRLMAQASAYADLVGENVTLRKALERIASARTAMDGGSISECRQIARAALTAQEKKRDD
jgi:hypothetical protein